MNIAVVGLGLIGGSLCRSIKAYTNHRVSGQDICPHVVDSALKEGVIDQQVENYSLYDMVLVCLYPQDTIEFLQSHVNQFSVGTLVIDCCGVKEQICAKAENIFANSGAIFIGGHPMAGKEVSGYYNSCADLLAVRV